MLLVADACTCPCASADAHGRVHGWSTSLNRKHLLGGVVALAGKRWVLPYRIVPLPPVGQLENPDLDYLYLAQAFASTATIRRDMRNGHVGRRSVA
jgi:hypothetical protein